MLIKLKHCNPNFLDYLSLKEVGCSFLEYVSLLKGGEVDLPTSEMFLLSDAYRPRFIIDVPEPVRREIFKYEGAIDYEQVQ